MRDVEKSILLLARKFKFGAGEIYIKTGAKYAKYEQLVNVTKEKKHGIWGFSGFGNKHNLVSKTENSTMRRI